MRFGRRRVAPAPIEVVGRVGLTRGTAAVAIRFGDRVVLDRGCRAGPVQRDHRDVGRRLGRAPHGPGADLVATATSTVVAQSSPVVGARPSFVGPRPSFVEALRQATARHA